MKQSFTKGRFFLLFLLCISFSLKSQVSSILINERFDDSSLRETLSRLGEKYQITFAFDEAAIEDIRVNRNLSNIPLPEALSKILFQTGLTYQLGDQNQVLIGAFPSAKAEFRLTELLVSGQVLDAESGTALPYATIACSENRGTTSDVEGNFSLRVFAFSDTVGLTIQFLGYRSQQLHFAVSDRPMKIVVELSPKVHAFEQITVLDKVPLYATDDLSNAMVFRPKAMDALPDFVGGKDLFRSLQMLPGISAHDDLSAGLKIRGADSDENMIVLDGMTLYNVGHFFGIFSAVNPNVIDKVSVYKNAFPIEYGAYTAGVIEMESIDLKRKRFDAGIELNLLTSNAYLNFPLTSNMDFLVAGRITNQNLGNTTYFDLLDKQETKSRGGRKENSTLSRNSLLSIKPDFRFYDLNAKWTWRLHPKTTMSANFYRGYDQYNYSYTNSFTNQLLGAEVENKEFFKEDRFWSNNAFSWIVNHQWNKNLESSLTLGHTAYSTEGGSESYLYRERGMVKDTMQRINRGANELKSYDVNWKNSWTIDSEQKLTFGYNGVYNDLNLMVNINDSSIVNVADGGTHQSLYVSYDLQKGPYHFNVGLRNTHYSETQKFYFSPRIQIDRTFNTDWKLKASWSLQNQFLKQSTYENPFGRTINYWVLADNSRRFPVASSNHFMLGLNYEAKDFEVDVEFYYNHTDGIVEQAVQIPGLGNNQMGNPTSSNFIRYVGQRKALGMDLSLKKYWGNYMGWLAYTLSRTTDEYPGINRGKAFSSENDRRHQLKWVNQYRLGKWNFSATYVFASGKPYTDLSKLEASDSRLDLKPDDFRTRLKPYHRVDIGIDRSFKWKGLDATFGLSVFNLLNTNNVKYLQYIYNIPETNDNTMLLKNSIIGTELELLGITPNLSFSIKF